ncbi:PilZ domain-containing protein [Cohnella cholangitidis]|uniref:PilZ domain-containing protein n=1 Tax=Cohnella cholangitidis TaxID=2598458 RepID=A0A7G5BVR0_9BACL|nr:PilZ domain-containing protein [Cohnella cholangitidis]
MRSVRARGNREADRIFACRHPIHAFDRLCEIRSAIALLQPPEVQKRFKERREHPRVEINGNAHIFHVLSDSGEELALDQSVALTIHDISIAGISFSGQDAPHLVTKSRLKAKVEIGFDFNCELEIVRRERQEDRLHWGAKMQVLEPEMLRPLRALILRQQVEKHAQTRRDLGKKRSFGSGNG